MTKPFILLLFLIIQILFSIPFKFHNLELITPISPHQPSKPHLNQQIPFTSPLFHQETSRTSRKKRRKIKKKVDGRNDHETITKRSIFFLLRRVISKWENSLSHSPLALEERLVLKSIILECPNSQQSYDRESF
jgi:hypothetical protein